MMMIMMVMKRRRRSRHRSLLSAVEFLGKTNLYISIHSYKPYSNLEGACGQDAGAEYDGGP